MKVDPDLVVPDRGCPCARAPSRPGRNRPRLITRRRWRRSRAITSSASTRRWAEFPAKARAVILDGSGGEEVRFAYEDGLRAYEVRSPSRASSPISTGATARPRANGRARRSCAT